jgi:hypothetical protein
LTSPNRGLIVKGSNKISPAHVEAIVRELHESAE